MPSVPHPRQGAGMGFGASIQNLPRTRRRDERDLAERILDLNLEFERPVDHQAEARQEEATAYLTSAEGEQDFLSRLRDAVSGMGEKSNGRARQIERRQERDIRRQEAVRAQARAQAEARQSVEPPALEAPVFDLEYRETVEDRYNAWIVNGDGSDEMFDTRDDGF